MSFALFLYTVNHQQLRAVTFTCNPKPILTRIQLRTVITLHKNMEADASQSRAGRKINFYSTEFKLEAVRFAVECNSNHKAAKRFNVDRKRIREWRANQSKLDSASCKRKRLDGAGRKPFDLDIEEVLLEWVHDDALMVFVYQGK